MAFDVGAVEGKLKLNTAEWNKKLANSQNTLKKFSAASVAKFAAIGVAVVAMTKITINSFKKIMNLAGQQEAAELELAQAIDITGQSANTSVEYLKDYAAHIQSITTYGDEAVLPLMKLALMFGVSGENIGTASKQAIGLADVLGTDLRTAMRYIALAWQGEFTMLQRYIPALRTVKTQTEKVVVVNEFLSKAWEASQSKADTYIGRVKQLKNVWGDFLEKIGTKLIPFFEILIRMMMLAVDKLNVWMKGIKISDETIIKFGETVKKIAIGIVKFVMVVERLIRKIAAMFLMLAGQGAKAKSMIEGITTGAKKYGDIMREIRDINIKELVPQLREKPKIFEPLGEGITLPKAAEVEAGKAQAGAEKYVMPKLTEEDIAHGASGFTPYTPAKTELTVQFLTPSQLGDAQLEEVAKAIVPKIEELSRARR